MASLRDIRKRIRSVKNTQQITRAMRMISAAKLRKAQEAIIAARPYAQMLDAIIADVSAKSETLAHPLLTARETKRAEVLVLTSDRGLAGGFNANVNRRVTRFLYENARGYPSIQLSTVGRKGSEFFKRQGTSVRKDYAGLWGRLSYPAVAEVAQELSADYLAGRTDAVFISYNEFVSAISQRVVLEQILPFKSPGDPKGQPDPLTTPRSLVDFEYEPSQQAVLDTLVPRAFAIRIWRAMLESVASEHGARMSAMESATSNAADAIDRLTLTYNRTRQAVITTELMEIVSGAEALK